MFFPEAKPDLHQACELYYKLLKRILSLRNQEPEEIQFQWALCCEASKELHIAELVMKSVSKDKDAHVSCAPAKEQSLVHVVEEADDDGS